MSYQRELYYTEGYEPTWFSARYYKGKKLITEEKYFKYVRGRLKKSQYARQEMDFFFMRMPDNLKNHPNFTTKYIPIDWLFKNIVEYLWGQGIMTQNLDQGDEVNPAFIRLYKSKKVIKLLEKLNLKYKIEKECYFLVEFKENKFEKIHKLLGLKIPDPNKAYTGGLIEQVWLNNDTKKFIYENVKDVSLYPIELPLFIVSKMNFETEEGQN